MEFVNGRNLNHILDEINSFLPEAQIVGWALELCDVLDYLHSNKPEPVIFRDIKPGNVMSVVISITKRPAMRIMA